MRYATLTLTLATLLTGCVGASTPDAQAVTAPGSSCDTGNHAVSAVALILAAPDQLIRGTSQAIVATMIDANGTRSDVTSMVSWASTNFLTAAATKGKLYAIGVGSATISASLGEISATADVSVLPVTLQALSLNADTETAPAGSVIAWHVDGHYNDGSTDDVTGSARWSTSDASVATVDDAGNVHTVASGMAMITVSIDGVDAAAPMMVTP